MIYRYVPEIIRYYLGEEPILDNVPRTCRAIPSTWIMFSATSVLVVKPANESGGYGMLMGPSADEEELEEFRCRIVGARATTSPSR